MSAIFFISKLLWSPKIKYQMHWWEGCRPRLIDGLYICTCFQKRGQVPHVLPLLLPLAVVLNVWGGSGPIYPKPPGQISQTPIPKFNASIRFDIVDMLQSFNFHQNSNLQFPLVFSILLLLHPDSSPLSHEPLLRPCRFCTAYYCRTVVAQQTRQQGFQMFQLFTKLNTSQCNWAQCGQPNFSSYSILPLRDRMDRYVFDV